MWVLPAKNHWSYYKNYYKANDDFFLLTDFSTKEENMMSPGGNEYKTGHWSTCNHDFFGERKYGQSPEIIPMRHLKCTDTEI